MLPTASADFIERTRQVWGRVAGRPLSTEDAREIAHNMAGFIGILTEWAEEDARNRLRDDTDKQPPKEVEQGLGGDLQDRAAAAWSAKFMEVLGPFRRPCWHVIFSYHHKAAEGAVLEDMRKFAKFFDVDTLMEPRWVATTCRGCRYDRSKRLHGHMVVSGVGVIIPRRWSHGLVKPIEIKTVAHFENAVDYLARKAALGPELPATSAELGFARVGFPSIG